MLFQLRRKKSVERTRRKPSRRKREPRRTGTAPAGRKGLLGLAIGVAVAVICGPILVLMAMAAFEKIGHAVELEAAGPEALLVDRSVIGDLEEARTKLRGLESGDDQAVARIRSELQTDLSKRFGWWVERSGAYVYRVPDDDSIESEVDRILGRFEQAPQILAANPNPKPLSLALPGDTRQRAQFLDAVAALLLLAALAVVATGVGRGVRDLTRPSSDLEWLCTLPVRTRSLMLSKAGEYALTSVVSWLFGASFGILCTVELGVGGLALALVLTPAATMLVASARLVAETIARTRLSAPWASTLQVLGAVLGSVVCFGPLYAIQAPDPSLTQGFVHAVPEGVRHASLLPLVLEYPLVGAALACAGLLFVPLLAAALCERLLADGLVRGSALKGSRGASKPIDRGLGIAGRELRILLRDRTHLTQTVAVPAILITLNLFANPALAGATEVASFSTGLAIVFGCAVYAGLIASSRLLVIEGQSIWMLWSFPQPVAEILRRKTVLIRNAALLVFVVGFAGFAVLPQSVFEVGRLALAMVNAALLIEIICGVAVHGTRDVETPDRARIGAASGYLSLVFLAVGVSVVVLDHWWLGLALSAQLIAIRAALWQAVDRGTPYLLDPGAAPPARGLAYHGLVASLVFFAMQTGLQIALKSSGYEAVTSTTVAYGGAAAITALVILIAMPQRNYPNVYRFSIAPDRLGRALATFVILTGVTTATGAMYLQLVADMDWFRAAIEERPDFQHLHTGIQLVVLMVILAPMLEEWLFRGLIYTGLRTSTSPRTAILISAMVFTSVHPAASWIPVFVLGVCTAIARERTGSLAIPMAIHAAHNWAVMAMQPTG